MAKNIDRGLDAIIRGTEELIRDIPDPGSLTEAAFLPEIAAEGHAAAQASLASLIEPTVDGMVDISVSPDGMTVHATFFPPGGDGKPLDLERVMEAVKGKGVTTGVDELAIRTCLLKCNEQRTRVSDALIARGTRAVNEVPPYLVANAALLARPQEGVTGSRIDFKALSPFTMVKKGDVIASLTPMQGGAMGTTVRGAAVAFKKETKLGPKPGKNTQWVEGSLLAACDGRFQSTIMSVWVEEVLDIKGDVDYHAGNIDFPGDVAVHGDIKDGFSVKAGKSLFCMRSVEACQIDCGGDFVTQRGIIGKEKARLRIGGMTAAKFIEGCSLDCGGSVFVETSVLNSRIRTRGRLDTGERGIIIGGAVTAQNGVSAAQIGTERGPRTEIHCGIDYTVEQKLIWIRDRNIALAFKLREIENKMKSSPATSTVLGPLRDKIKLAIHQLNESARALVGSLDRNEAADVSVREAVFPGTYIEICHISHFVTKPRRFVTFRLDMPSGKIVEVPWQKPQGEKPPALP
jgi:uncharacterized protein